MGGVGGARVQASHVVTKSSTKGGVTQDDWQRLFLVQYSVAMLEQCCNHSKQCRNNVAMLCSAKKRH